MPEFSGLKTAFITLVIAMSYTLGCQADSKIDACRLISDAKASSILGTKITAKPINTSAAGPDSGSMCNYSGSKMSDGFMLIVGRVQYSNAESEVKKRQKEAVSDTPPGIPKPTFDQINHLGDAAYLAKTSVYFQLHVLAHGNVIVINRNVAASKKTVEQAKQIARVVLEHL